MRVASWAAGAIVLAVALIVASCAGPGSSTPAVSPTDTPVPSSSLPGLDGRTFLAMDANHALVPDTRISVSFEQPGQIRMQAGCNSLSGPVASADGRLTVGSLESTEMGCAAPLMRQDAWLARFLDSRPSWQLRGDILTLTSGVTTITFADRRIAEPDRALEGTVWTLDGIIDGDSVSSVPQGITATMSVQDGQVSFTAGCNTYSGQGTFDRTAVRVQLSATDVGCRGAVGDVETSMSGVLGDFSYGITAGSLTATGAKGTGLMFTAAQAARTTAVIAPDPGATPTPTTTG